MKKHTELLRFRSKVYTRVKAVILTDELVEKLSLLELKRLKSIFIYDFYDNIKRLTSEVTLLNDNKRLKDNNCLTFAATLEIQLKNIIFLSKKIVKFKNRETIERNKNQPKELIYGEFD